LWGFVPPSAALIIGKTAGCSASCEAGLPLFAVAERHSLFIFSPQRAGKHTVKVALPVDSDIQTAQDRLNAAVETVYQGYRQSIEP
jgi:hypothetical protein